MGKINFKLNDDLSQFGLKRKRLATGYSTLADTIRTIKHSNASQNGNRNLIDLTQYTEGSQLDQFFQNPGNTEKPSILSATLYKTNPIYQKIIDYFKDMYYWRYVTTPRKIKDGDKKTGKKDYKEIYDWMLEITDGISIETTFPLLLWTIFTKGKAYIYATKDTPSRTVQTIILPQKYCRPALKTQYGTRQIEFDYSFFDNQTLTEDQKLDFLKLFPNEFTIGYQQYCQDRELYKWQALNGKLSTVIEMNDNGFPSFLAIFYDLIDYKTYKMNELDRSTNKLERLVTQEIDLEKTGLDLTEVKDLHDSMADVICQNQGSTLVTSVGTLNVHQLQEDANDQNDALNQSYNTIFSNAGINYNLFNGSIAESLDASLKRDLAFVWTYIEQLVAFYNVAINNLINFGDFQYSLKVLPISSYNEKDKLEFYKSNAEYGVGIVDLMVASGIKQVDIESTLEMEEYLDLANRLVPLQSSHTLSSSDETASSDSKSSSSSNDSKTATASKSSTTPKTTTSSTTSTSEKKTTTKESDKSSSKDSDKE